MIWYSWLLARLPIDPNAFYNYRKRRKLGYDAHKAEVMGQMEEICHEHNGVDGYRSMAAYLERKGCSDRILRIRKRNVEYGKAGYPYGNAPIEWYFNTLKHECVNLHEYQTGEQLYAAAGEFAYVHYNHVRPHR